MISYLANRDGGRPSVLRDAGTGAVWFAVGLLFVWGLPEAGIVWWGPDTGTTTASVLTMAVACAAAAVRRIAVPAGLLVATAALVAGPVVGGRTEIGTVLVFTDLLYCAVLYPSRRTARAVAVAAGVLATVLALVTLVTAGTRTAAYSVLNLALVVGVPLVWGLEVRRFRDLARAERARAAEAERAVARERDAAVAAERARMARDLHDVVAGRLSAIALQSAAALQPGADPALVRRVLGTVRESGVAALGEMRAMIGLLRDGDGAATDPRGAPARLSEVDALLDEARAAGLHPRIDDDRGSVALPAPVDLAGYRIVQESLTNAAKHAPGSTVTVRLGLDPGPAPRRVAPPAPAGSPATGMVCRPAVLLIEVGNGPGERATEGPGLHGGTGLDGLRERARAVGGSFDAGPDGDGWLVRALLPLATEEVPR
ncbi:MULTISPECIES: histidine kinase [unclassified Pseudonocardia]|uniref:sensor histidine kinase n=1 Tax=unclassified Pseudonocardia TaxID=2619320 RepID=UPI0009673727|nr:histidine kinase [Pseudonocardia sp. Ae707_Ps1]OLM21032.1 putative two-component system sensor kinase [Pseudonocardia sp. Ae707_Ps1]